MKFKLPEIDLSGYDYLFCGNGKRKATSTDVIYISEDRLIASSLLSKKLYLVSVDGEELNIIDEITTDGFIDLMDYKDGVIVASNASVDGLYGSASIFKIVDDKIISVKTINAPNRIRTHGCLIVDDKHVIIGSNDERAAGLYFLNIDTKEFYKTIKYSLRVKDLCFNGDKLLVITAETAPSEGQVTVSNSILYLYDFKSMELLNSLTFKGQCDAISMVGEDGFITLQCEHSLIHFKLQDNGLKFIKLIDGFNFPHGIDSRFGKVLVTNYGDNSIDILSFSDLIK
jgi:hypothetical protein